MVVSAPFAVVDNNLLDKNILGYWISLISIAMMTNCEHTTSLRHYYDNTIIPFFDHFNSKTMIDRDLIVKFIFLMLFLVNTMKKASMLYDLIIPSNEESYVWVVREPLEVACMFTIGSVNDFFVDVGTIYDDLEVMAPKVNKYICCDYLMI